MENIAELKSGLHHRIAEIDDVQTLTELQQFINKLINDGEKIIAFTTDGRALNQKAYKANIDQAIAEARNGNTITIDELEKEL